MSILVCINGGRCILQIMWIHINVRQAQFKLAKGCQKKKNNFLIYPNRKYVIVIP